jgi:hypothetical protein
MIPHFIRIWLDPMRSPLLVARSPRVGDEPNKKETSDKQQKDRKPPSLGHDYC